MAKPVPAINEPFVGLDGRITDVWYKYLLSLGYSDSNSGNGGSSDSISFLKFEFDDHIRNNLSWLRADTFSWQDGEVYVGVYEHLLEDIEGKELQSETIGGITIQYYLADDMHKICPATEEIPIMNLYNNIGIAWYYIIDTDNKFFKLPRTKWGFTGLRNEVGKYIEQQIKIPNHYHIISTMGANAGNFVATNTADTIDRADTTSIGTGYRSWNGRGGGGDFVSQTTQFTGSLITTVAKEAQSKNGYEYGAYGNSTLVQPPATQMYLYFYVGDADGNDIRKIASANLEKLNSKADTNLNNVSTTSGLRRLVEVYNNGASYYKVFEEYNPIDGSYIGKWCEQGGSFYTNSSGIITFLKTFKDQNYLVLEGIQPGDSETTLGVIPHFYKTKFKDTIRYGRDGWSGSYTGAILNWEAKGYIEE